MAAPARTPRVTPGIGRRTALAAGAAWAASLGGCMSRGMPQPVIDAVDAQALQPDFHGVVLLAGPAARRPLVRAHGVADAEAGRAATAQTRYQVGSVSKWLTTIVVLRLVDQGRLRLEAPIGQWLDVLPPATAAQVTLNDLLSNTSGIPNGVIAAFKQDARLATVRMTALEAAERFAAGALQSVPGRAWDYSHTNWIVVRAIVEQVTGRAFERVVAEQLTDPLALADTGIPAEHFAEVPGAAMAYRTLAPVPQRKMEPVPTYVAASGTFYSTAADLHRTASAVYAGRHLSAPSLQALSTVRVPAQQYALGGRVKTLRLGGADRPVAWQTGSLGGYKSLLAHLPGDAVTVVLLNNTDLPQARLDATAEALLHAACAEGLRGPA